MHVQREDLRMYVDLTSFASYMEQMIRRGEIELRTRKEQLASKIVRVVYDREHGLRVIVGRAFSNGFFPNIRLDLKEVEEQVTYDFRQVAVQLTIEELEEKAKDTRTIVRIDPGRTSIVQKPPMEPSAQGEQKERKPIEHSNGAN